MLNLAINIFLLQDSELFRLKKSHKNLSNEKYAKNLTAYVKRISSHIAMDMEDFKEALIKLKM